MDYDTKLIENTDVTYLVDFEKGRVVGIGGGIEAIKQKCIFALNTERFMFPIYSNNNGIETIDLIGRNKSFVNALIGKRVRDTLLQISSIKNVYDIQVTNNDDKLFIKFKLDTIYGTTEMEKIL